MLQGRHEQHGTGYSALCDLAGSYCLLGATNDETAELFGVSPCTIDSWVAAP